VDLLALDEHVYELVNALCSSLWLFRGLDPKQDRITIPAVEGLKELLGFWQLVQARSEIRRSQRP